MRPHAGFGIPCETEKTPCLAKRAGRYHGGSDMAMPLAQIFSDRRIFLAIGPPYIFSNLRVLARGEGK